MGGGGARSGGGGRGERGRGRGRGARGGRRAAGRGRVPVGPLRVGYRLTEQSLVFGGDALTATDVAVAAGLLDVGDRRRVASLPPALVKEVLASAAAMIEEGVDRMKTDAREEPLIAVGGGCFLVPERLAGGSGVAPVPAAAGPKPGGAAIAQVSGEV